MRITERFFYFLFILFYFYVPLAREIEVVIKLDQYAKEATPSILSLYDLGTQSSPSERAPRR